MRTLIIARSHFNLKKFLKAIRDFTLVMGGDEAFPIVQDNVAIYDADFCDMLDEDAEIPDNPVERLEAGHTLFCPFSLCRDFDLLACADGTEIEVPDLDIEDEDEGSLTEEQRELIGRTHCDENRSYGLLVTLRGKKIVIQSAQMCDLSGDCEVEAVKDAGLVEEPMRAWVDSFLLPTRGGTR